RVAEGRSHSSMLSVAYGALGTLRSFRGRSVLEDAGRRGGNDAPSAVANLLRLPGGPARAGRLAAGRTPPARPRVIAAVELMRAGVATAAEEEAIVAGLQDPDPALRLFIVSRFRDDLEGRWPPRTRDWLATRLADDRDTAVRLATLEAFGMIGMSGDQRACGRTRAGMAGPDRAARRAALNASTRCLSSL